MLDGWLINRRFLPAVVWVIILLPFIGGGQPALAERDKQFDTITLYWENDTFAGTDQDYTNGFRITWSTPFQVDHGEDRLPDWSYPVINRLPFVNDPFTERAVSLAIGQNIYTPSDISRSEMIVDERSYAGELYLAAGFHNRTSDRKNNWELRLGVVGPLALGEEVQNGVHGALGIDKARGWDNQLGNELILEGICESKWRLWRSSLGTTGLGYDLIPHLGGRFGNVDLYGNAGFEARMGWNLPGNFGSCPIRAGCETNSAFGGGGGKAVLRPFRLNLFGSVDGRLVLYDIFLDGSLFGGSSTVDKEYTVADIMVGIAGEWGNYRFSYSYIYRTRQYKTQKDDQVYGAFSLSCPF